MPRVRVLIAPMLMAIAASASAPRAYAQSPSGSDRVAAEALFEEGRSLLAAGKYAEACPKFADSERLDPSPATLLNLANCREKLGQTATAWVTYREAASAANALGRADYLATAQRHADALAPRLARMTIQVPQPPEGIEVRRDGAIVTSAEWGEPIPVDPGTHTIQARAPGRNEWTVAAVALEASQVTVTVPSLEPAATPPPPPLTPPPAPAPPSSAATPGAGAPLAPAADHAASDSAGSSQRTLGVVAASVGVAGLIAGGAFALVAKSKYNDSLHDCEAANVNLCNRAGFDERGDARTFGDVATVSVAVGAAAFVAGGVLWFTAPRGVAPTVGRVAILPSLGGAVVQGVW